MPPDLKVKGFLAPTRAFGEFASLSCFFFLGSSDSFLPNTLFSCSLRFSA